MEIFNVNSCTEELIDLKSESQLESLLNMIKDSKEIMVRWEAEDEDSGEMMKKSKILITDELLVRLKDGRLALTSSKEKEE